LLHNVFKKGQTVLFQGDSVTDAGRDYTDPGSLGPGYASKIAQIYSALFPGNGVTFINRGVSGNRSRDLLTRYDKDFKEVCPDFISILIGINDTWRRFDRDDPTTSQQFEANYRELLTRCKTDLPQAKIMLIEPFVLPTLPDRAAWRVDLDPKIHVVRELASEFADYYLPLDGIFASLAVRQYTCAEITEDGVHPTQTGHGIIAYEYLKLLGVL
jgi:lysophospholipase L1-like esterase